MVFELNLAMVLPGKKCVVDHELFVHENIIQIRSHVWTNTF